MVEQGELLPVTRAETLVFLGEGFRNIRLDTLSNDDLADISGALSSFRTRPSTDFERGLEAGAIADLAFTADIAGRGLHRISVASVSELLRLINGGARFSNIRLALIPPVKP